MPRTFTAIENFESKETQSAYVAGLSYTARDEDEVLLDLIDEWIDDGKVREGGPEAKVSGTAEVGEGTKQPDKD